MNKYILLIFICFMSVTESFTQKQDLFNVLENIRNKYILIHNQKIKGLEKCTFQVNLNAEEDESALGIQHEYDFYFKDKNIYLIREYVLSDEGGPLSYSAFLSETYLYEDKVFFYYQKEFNGLEFDERGQVIYCLSENRQYIHEGKIVKELSKQTQKKGLWIYEKTDLLNVKTDTVPNIEKPLKSLNDFYWNSDVKENYLKMIEEAKQRENSH